MKTEFVKSAKIQAIGWRPNMRQSTRSEKILIEKSTGETCLMTDVLRYPSETDEGAILEFIILISKDGLLANWICSDYEYIGDL
jgi:hypothetical protein